MKWKLSDNIKDQVLIYIVGYIAYRFKSKYDTQVFKHVSYQLSMMKIGYILFLKENAVE